jgi:hypothetical protein
MTIHIKLHSGETVETSRHTKEQALAAKDAGVGLKVGGVYELGYADMVDEADIPAERTIGPADIASIEEVPA